MQLSDTGLPVRDLPASSTAAYRYLVITPVRNEEAYLESTIESMLAQTVCPQEWIIVNDGSTDRTGQIIDDYARRFPWIRAVHRKDRGFRKAGGGVVADSVQEAEDQETVNKARALLAAAEEAVRFASAAKKGQ